MSDAALPFGRAPARTGNFPAVPVAWILCDPRRQPGARCPVFPFLDMWPAEWVIPAQGLDHRRLRLVRRLWPSPSRAPSPGCSPSPWRFVEALLFRGVLAWKWPPLPWIAIVAGATILGHWAGGRAHRALLPALCSLLSGDLRPVGRRHADLGASSSSTVPLAAALGLAFGIWATRNARVENAS